MMPRCQHVTQRWLGAVPFLCVAFFVGSAACAQAREPVADNSFTIADLRADYRINPIGIGRSPPNLSWRMEAGGRAGAAQAAYRIQSAGSCEDLADGKTLWDSGTVASDASTQIPYGGPALRNGERIWWRVRITDERGEESPWSTPAWFEMGLLGEEDWRGAQWIGCDRRYDGPQYAPRDRMGSWVEPPPGLQAISLFKDIDLPDMAVVSAVAWWGLSKKMGPAAVVANYDAAEGRLRGRLDRIMAPRQHGFIDMAFFLKPGEINRVELRLEKPAHDFAATVGMQIVFADGTEMSLASGKDWRARPVGTGAQPFAVAVAEPYGGPRFGQAVQFADTELAPAWFRGKIEGRAGLKRARLYLSALGQGQSFVNGVPVDETLLGPPQSDYEEWAFYTTQDITALLRPGPNAVSVLLDAGWYHEVGGFGSGFSYGRPGLRALIAMEFADGKTEWFTSGPGWQWKEGAIRSANIYRGERVDFRRDHDEWKEPDAGTGWSPAQVIPPVSPKTIPMDLDPIRRGGQLRPTKHWQIGPKTWLFDVGEMIHGWVRFGMCEPVGATVRLRYSEYARDGVMGNVPASHWWCHGVPQSDEVISDGKRRVFEPTFTPKSFRFVEVSGLTEPPEDLVAFTVHTDARPLATFESSDPMLDRLFANGMRAWRNYVNHFIMDIPRERCLWGAESIYSEVPATYCYDFAANHRLMNRLWLTGAMTPQGIPGNIGVGKRLSTVTSGYIWSVSPLFISSLLLDHYGDIDPARTYYDKLRLLVLEYPIKNGERDGTIPTPHRLADHAPISDVKRNLAKGDLITAMVYYEALNRFARIAEAVGKAGDAARARESAARVRATVLSFYDPEKHTFGNGTHDSLALAYGVMADPREAERLASSLAGHYRANGHQFDGGFMSHEIYPQLSRHGYVDDAVQMLVNTGPPGPARSVKEYDATSFWEAYYLDHDFQMNRGLNFIAFAHPIGWMITDLAGIRYVPGIPSGRRILLVPAVPGAGTPSRVNASLETPAGRAGSAWALKDEGFFWEFTVPANVIAEVRIPAVEALAVKGADGMKPLGFKDGVATYEARPGSYSIGSRLARRVPVAAPPTSKEEAETSGGGLEWKVSPGSAARFFGGNLIVTAGDRPTQMLTTALPPFSKGKTTLCFRLKTAAKSDGMVRLVSVAGGTKRAQTAEFRLGPPGTWQDYAVAIPDFEGKPFSLWIGLAREKEALAFGAISLVDTSGRALKTWRFGGLK